MGTRYQHCNELVNFRSSGKNFLPATQLFTRRKEGRGGNFLVYNFCDLLKQERKSQRRKLRKWTTTAVVTADDVAAVVVVAAASKLTPTKHIETQFIL